jgi:hypothetical protein
VETRSGPGSSGSSISACLVLRRTWTFDSEVVESIMRGVQDVFRISKDFEVHETLSIGFGVGVCDLRVTSRAVKMLEMNSTLCFLIGHSIMKDASSGPGS